MWLQTFAAEIQITLADPTVWLSIGQGLLVGGVCLLFGVRIARVVGLLQTDPPAGELLGVGLASGLVVLAAFWAAIASGGRSALTPVAFGFAVGIGLAVVQRRTATEVNALAPVGEASQVSALAPARASRGRRDLMLAILGGGLFVAVVAILYGSTMTLGPRNGVQPLEFMDEAYYSILGADLANTGTETIYSPSGFTRIDGLPGQTWYHWGELWLASAVIRLFGTAPLDARHFVVLPLILLATATLTGTLVRRMTGSTSRAAFLFGFLACIFLAPVAFISGPYFSSWAVGLVFGITMYGLAAVAVVLAMYGLTVLGSRSATWALACFLGSAIAFIVPAHVVIAILALVGVGSVMAIRVGRSLLETRRLPEMSPAWRRTCAATGVIIFATVMWGALTGHSVGGSGLSTSVSPFNASWRETMAIVTLGLGAYLAIPIAWLLVRIERSIEANLYLGTAVLLVVGAIVWGARLGDFNTFHVFFAGLAVFATPVAAVAFWSIWLRLRASGHRRLAVALLLLCAAQLEVGVVTGIVRLASFGTGVYPPVSTEILADIRELPLDAKLAYACQPLEELAFWDARLLGIDAHTGRRVVPMCFQADFFGQLIGTPASPVALSPLFQWAPQRALYPDSGAQPSAASVAAFLRANGIEYIYVDALHPNTLVPDAVPIANSRDSQVLRLP